MAKIIRNKAILLAVLVSMVVLASLAWPHCQVPCGIYNDQMRFDMISEHIATIEKSMKQTTGLANIEKLRSVLDSFHHAYFGDADTAEHKH